MGSRQGGRSRTIGAGACATAVAVGVAMTMIGCSRSYYRNYADKDVYAIERERAVDPRWRVPARPVEADPKSRIGDPFDPDREPIPLDDPAARLFQVTNGRHGEFHGWAKRGVADIERQDWKNCLAVDEDGSVKLGQESVMRVALLNSREYQTQVETLYLAALALTLARYDFYLQPFATQQTLFNQIGGGRTEKNQLTLANGAGFSQNFASGGQLMVDFANAMVFQFNNHGFQAVTSNIAIAFTQPLLRGAFARIRTQALSLQERQVVYALRDFARFRRQFYVGVVAGNGYLGLLQTVQNIRNQEEQVRTFARNLEEQEALAASGAVSLKDRDIMAQSYQSAQLQLINFQVGFQSQLDQYKLVLGLPTEIVVKLDDAPLKTFELSDPGLDVLRKTVEALYLTLLQAQAAPSNAELADSAGALRENFAALGAILDRADGEVRAWRKKLGQVDKDSEELPLPELPPSKDPDEARQIELSTKLAAGLVETRSRMAENVAALDALIARAARGQGDADRNGSALRDLINKEFRARLSDVFVTQNQARVYLIDLPAVDLSSEEAVSLALENRLDLMNARGAVTDAWRTEELDANQLLAGLNIIYNGNVATDPAHKGILRFDSSPNGLHKIGIQFDAPLIRRVERNNYRSQQVAYQQARRAWIATRDQAVYALRQDIRQLGLARRSFEISRVQLVIAARQVEEAEYDQRNKRTTESSNTLLLLNGLQSLLSAKNQLINNWVNYLTVRMSLYRDLDLMDIDDRGVWLNERDSLRRGADRAPDPEPPPSRRDGSSPPPP